MLVVFAKTASVMPLVLSMDIVGDDERARGASFREAVDRNAYLACHGLKRLVLGGACGCAPIELEFKYDLAGRPRLMSHSFSFSITRRTQWVGVGVTKCRQIGIDVEEDQPIGGWERVVSEISVVEEQRNYSGVALWTAKEAVLKALGSGFSVDAREVAIVGRQWNFSSSGVGAGIAGFWHRLDERHLVAVACSATAVHFDPVVWSTPSEVRDGMSAIRNDGSLSRHLRA